MTPGRGEGGQTEITTYRFMRPTGRLGENLFCAYPDKKKYFSFNHQLPPPMNHRPQPLMAEGGNDRSKYFTTKWGNF